MIEFAIADQIGRIVIHRPEAANAFTGAMVDRLAAAITEAAGSCQILLITGQGADFTLGRDRAEPKTGSPFDAFSKIDGVNRALAAFPGISIAAIQGRAFGLGVGLTMRCDLAVADANARFCLDEVKLGFPPMFIMEEILQHFTPKRAADVVLLSREFGADEALEVGLLSRCAPAGQLAATVEDMIAELRLRDAGVLRACKSYMRTVRDLPADARASYALVAQTRFAQANH
ncbi:enoyl-CoA hydratase/carnithine racemase [Rhodoligotrophos appendicifer]|uniref:enoyl-CoA hydratase/isomerase family protein n=1 Tax=Rhodoligotrophos appendicifer TaxID=987056 RepID=UPI0014782B46|nr:enoyl-CoA hydratase/isomerase family protein [Rhodoligotrophos appendicifer]